MPKAPLDDIAKWSKADQKAALVRLRFLVGKDAEILQANDFEHDWLLAGLRVELKKRSLPSTTPLAILQGFSEWKQFGEACQEVGPWAREALPGAEKDLLRAFSVLAAHCLAQHVSSFRPVTMRALLHFYERTPEAFDKAFPGYIANGWVQMILQRDGV